MKGLGGMGGNRRGWVDGGMSGTVSFTLVSVELFNISVCSIVFALVLRFGGMSCFPRSETDAPQPSLPFSCPHAPAILRFLSNLTLLSCPSLVQCALIFLLLFCSFHSLYVLFLRVFLRLPRHPTHPVAVPHVLRARHVVPKSHCVHRFVMIQNIVLVK